MKKALITSLLMLALIITGFSQSKEKIDEKSMEKVEELNAEIIAGDSSLAMTEDQKTKVYELFRERMMAAKKLKKANADKEEIKESNKVFNKRVWQEVLTKEQKKARRKAKKDDDDSEDDMEDDN